MPANKVFNEKEASPFPPYGPLPWQDLLSNIEQF